MFEAKGIDRSRYRFEPGDIFGHALMRASTWSCAWASWKSPPSRCGCSSCSTRPGRRSWSSTRSSRHSSSATFELSRVDDPDNRAEQMRVLLPSPRAVLELARDHGYGAVALAHNMTDYSGMDDYRERRRMAFICARGSRAGGPRGARRQARDRGAVAELADAPAGPRTAFPLERAARDASGADRSSRSSRANTRDHGHCSSHVSSERCGGRPLPPRPKATSSESIRRLAWIARPVRRWARSGISAERAGAVEDRLQHRLRALDEVLVAHEHAAARAAGP